MKSIASLLFALLAAVPAFAAEPTIVASPDGKRVDVRGLDAMVLEALKAQPPTAERWARGFAVRLDGKADQPAMFGSHEVADGVLRFTPRFPLVPGTKYRAVLDLDALLDQPAKDRKPLAADLLQPRAVTPPTVVRAVYPSSDVLPENQLKFYVHFSAPMSRGEAYCRVRLLDDQGKAVTSPFLELDEELWDPEGTRFTLYFDPGRIKSGLKPREDLGPILVEGRTYTLEINRAWEDAAGNPLRETFRKTFKVTAPQDTRVDPKTWKLAVDARTGALTVTFPRALDHALLERMLWIEDAQGKKVAGTILVEGAETRWRFTPREAWPAGKCWLMVDTRLEDLAGNNVARPFEVDAFPRIQPEVRVETVRLPIPGRE